MSVLKKEKKRKKRKKEKERKKKKKKEKKTEKSMREGIKFKLEEKTFINRSFIRISLSLDFTI
jgi:hypothetical protein